MSPVDSVQQWLYGKLKSSGKLDSLDQQQTRLVAKSLRKRIFLLSLWRWDYACGLVKVAQSGYRN